MAREHEFNIEEPSRHDQKPRLLHHQSDLPFPSARGGAQKRDVYG